MRVVRNVPTVGSLISLCASDEPGDAGIVAAVRELLASDEGKSGNQAALPMPSALIL